MQTWVTVRTRVTPSFRFRFFQGFAQFKVGFQQRINIFMCQNCHSMDSSTRSLQVQRPNHQCVSDQSGPAFVQSDSQSQAMLTFVTALEMDNFDCTKIDAHFSFECLPDDKIHSLSMGGAHSGSVPQTTTLHCSCAQLCSTNNNCIFQLKPSPDNHQLGLAYSHETQAYQRNTALATAAFLLFLDTNLLSQARLYSLLTATWHDSTQLLNFFLVTTKKNENRSRFRLIFKVPTTTITNLIINALLDANADRKLGLYGQ